MSHLQSTVIDYVTGRLDADAARQIETAAHHDILLASAISDARALNFRMRRRMVVQHNGASSRP